MKGGVYRMLTINVTNKTNSSELVSPYIGFLSIFCTELSAPIGRDALCQRPSTTRLTTVNKVPHARCYEVNTVFTRNAYRVNKIFAKCCTFY